jgi:hypothetical protein
MPVSLLPLGTLNRGVGAPDPRTELVEAAPGHAFVGVPTLNQGVSLLVPNLQTAVQGEQR